MSTKKNIENYRPGIGLMILNHENKIFLGKRSKESKKYWQMPQGGIQIGETPKAAAMREMLEEIGTNNCRIIAETNKWYFYDIPFKISAETWNKNYIGQMQKWFLIKFEGSDEEIDIISQENSEFQEWKWENLELVIKSAIPFKRKLYASVISEFANFLDKSVINEIIKK